MNTRRGTNKIFRNILALLLIAVTLIGTAISVDAKTSAAIRNNGKNGITIDIHSAPYTTYAQKSWGQYAYGESGCAWFASARVNQLTGIDSPILSGSSWYNSYYGSYGANGRGQTLQAKALACWSNHVAVVELVNGSTVTISEGGSAWEGASANNYCVIRDVSSSYFANDNRYGNGTWLGFVYLKGSSQTPDPGIATSWDLWTEFTQYHNAKIRGGLSTSASVQFTRAGAYVWDENGTLVAQGDEATSVKGYYLPIFYDLNGELGVTLQSGTTYTYQFWGDFGGNRYYSHKSTFSTTAYNPRGSLDSISGGAGTLQVWGWALDDDNLSAQLTIRIYVGNSLYEITANDHRDDVEQVFPGVGAYHGFLANIPVKETGTQNVKVIAVNVKGGEDTVLAERTVTIQKRSGLVIENGTPYVYDSNGNLIRNATPMINGKKYYVDGNGIARSGWLRLADWQMYFDPQTYAAVTGIAKIDGKAYLFDENGVEILRSRTEVINGKKYWFQPDGSLMSGWCQLGEWTMYYDPQTYVGATGLTRINGKTYIFDGNGVLVRNNTPIINGNKYYADGNGMAKTGWLRLAGWQMYFDPGTYAAATGITKIDGKAYLFDENGVEILKSRTETINGKIYWFQPDGSLMSGWCKLGSWTMYFDPETYEAAVGWKTIGGVTYLFDRNGVLQE